MNAPAVRIQMHEAAAVKVDEAMIFKQDGDFILRTSAGPLPLPGRGRVRHAEAAGVPDVPVL